jgi:site-specific recombinase XerD
MHLLRENPVKDIDSPKLQKSLPKYLTLDESVQLLDAVDGKNQERDYCILTLFLNCGLRISELVGLNISDIQDDALRVLGKGNKVRIIYLNDACQDALNRYLAVRRPIAGRDQNALFLSARNERVSRSTVHAMVKKRLGEAGIDSTQYSSHKLRHTAATLMLQNGVDVRAVQEVLGHDHLNTTEIYTHIDNESLRVAAKANPLSRVKRQRNVKDES